MPGRLRAEVDIDAVVEKVLEKIKDDPRFRGPVGPTGPSGPAGPAGPPGKVTEEQLSQIAAALYQQMQSDDRFRGQAGPPGPPGASPDIGEIVDRVKQQLPDIVVDVELPDGTIARRRSNFKNKTPDGPRIAPDEPYFKFKFDPGAFQLEGSRRE